MGSSRGVTREDQQAMNEPFPHEPGMAERPEPQLLEERVIPVIQEEMTVSPQQVETGRVRVRKSVSQDSVRVNEAITTEHVVTERVPIGAVVSEAPVMRQEGDVLVIPVVEERLVVRRELVLVEEIRLTRRRDARPSVQDVTLRRESVVVERLDPATQQWNVVDDVDGPARDPAQSRAKT
jgi:uncharacterized protein (TIGR02271 family)